MGKIEDGALKPSTTISFDIGEQVRVCDGPFASFRYLPDKLLSINPTYVILNIL
jgi:transcription antitermination factor NusG